jgi:hypothetical protein
MLRYIPEYFQPTVETFGPHRGAGHAIVALRDISAQSFRLPACSQTNDETRCESSPLPLSLKHSEQLQHLLTLP